MRVIFLEEGLRPGVFREAAAWLEEQKGTEHRRRALTDSSDRASLAPHEQKQDEKRSVSGVALLADSLDTSKIPEKPGYFTRLIARTPEYSKPVWDPESCSHPTSCWYDEPPAGRMSPHSRWRVVLLPL